MSALDRGSRAIFSPAKLSKRQGRDLVHQIESFAGLKIALDPRSSADIERHVTRLQHAVENYEPLKEREISPLHDSYSWQLQSRRWLIANPAVQQGDVMTLPDPAHPLERTPGLPGCRAVTSGRDEQDL